VSSGIRFPSQSSYALAAFRISMNFRSVAWAIEKCTPRGQKVGTMQQARRHHQHHPRFCHPPSDLGARKCEGSFVEPNVFIEGISSSAGRSTRCSIRAAAVAKIRIISCPLCTTDVNLTGIWSWTRPRSLLENIRRKNHRATREVRFGNLAQIKVNRHNQAARVADDDPIIDWLTKRKLRFNE